MDVVVTLNVPPAPTTPVPTIVAPLKSVMVSPTSPDPVTVTVWPFTGWPTTASPVGALGLTLTVNTGVDAVLVRLAASTCLAVKVCTPSLKVCVVVMSNVPPAPTMPVPTIAALPSA